MIYQVLTRQTTNTPWHPFAEATEDPFAVVRLIQLANQGAREVTVVQADDAGALEQVLGELARGERVAGSLSPVPSLTSTPRVSVSDPPLERRRWEAELGPGGDHDQPYAFVLPENEAVLTSWLRLFAQQRRTHPATEPLNRDVPQPRDHPGD